MHDTIEAIRQLKARYFRCMDSKDWAGLRDTMTDDILFDIRGGTAPSKIDDQYSDPPITGGDQAVDFLRKVLQHAVTIHQGFMPEIIVDSDNSASAVWAMEDIIRAPDGAPYREMHGFGHYHETYRRVSGEWRIASLRLTRLAVDIS